MVNHRGHSPRLLRFPMAIHLLRPFPPEHAYPRPPTTVTSIAGRVGQGSDRVRSGQLLRPLPSPHLTPD